MKQLKIHGFKILSHFSFGLFLLHYSWRDMFNSELVIADISSINCALYSLPISIYFSEFLFGKSSWGRGEYEKMQEPLCMCVCVYVLISISKHLKNVNNFISWGFTIREPGTVLNNYMWHFSLKNNLMKEIQLVIPLLRYEDWGLERLQN